MEESAFAQKRIAEIENEINILKKQQYILTEKWQAEKKLIAEIRKIKAEIEDVKFRADEFERQGELARVAELRYGKLHELEQKINASNIELNKIQSNNKLLKEEVTAEDIAEVVSKMTGIPIQKMLEAEKIKLLKMEERIHNRVIGQDEAIVAISNAVRRSRSGLQDSNKPIGSFIFLGPTGVGKTETARALAEFLFDDENAMIRIDMSEYMEKFSVSRLIGAPPGYVGYEEGGQLTESVRRRPYSVILLDEIEKANVDVLNLLLQVLDDGRLTDSKGRTVNFKNSIIIMTSNMGSDIIQSKLIDSKNNNYFSLLDQTRNEIVMLLKKTLKPEFLNRIDDIILFEPLNEIDINKIALLQLNKLSIKLKKMRINLVFSDKVLQQLALFGYDPQFGARPLKRAVQRYITDPLSVEILSGNIMPDDSVEIKIENNKFIFVKK